MPPIHDRLNFCEGLLVGNKLIRLAFLFISSGTSWHSPLNCGSHPHLQMCEHPLGERPRAALGVRTIPSNQSGTGSAGSKEGW